MYSYHTWNIMYCMNIKFPGYDVLTLTYMHVITHSAYKDACVLKYNPGTYTWNNTSVYRCLCVMIPWHINMKITHFLSTNMVVYYETTLAYIHEITYCLHIKMTVSGCIPHTMRHRHLFFWKKKKNSFTTATVLCSDLALMDETDFQGR